MSQCPLEPASSMVFALPLMCCAADLSMKSATPGSVRHVE